MTIFSHYDKAGLSASTTPHGTAFLTFYLVLLLLCLRQAAAQAISSDAVDFTSISVWNDLRVCLQSCFQTIRVSPATLAVPLTPVSVVQIPSGWLSKKSDQRAWLPAQMSRTSCPRLVSSPVTVWRKLHEHYQPNNTTVSHRCVYCNSHGCRFNCHAAFVSDSLSVCRVCLITTAAQFPTNLSYLDCLNTPGASYDWLLNMTVLLFERS